MSSDRQIPRYYLYGEPAADVERDFLHVEPILLRSGPNGWLIRAHAHPDHMQLMLVTRGGGTVRIEDRAHAIPAPAIVVLPAGLVHQFEFLPGTDGYVITAALGWLALTCAGDPRLAGAVARPAVLGLEGSGIEAATTATFEELLREFVWEAPGRRSAIMALFLRLLVVVLRLGLERDAPAAGPGDRDRDLLAAYRALVERHYRDQRSAAFYAARLAVTPARLNAACKARCGQSATAVLHERILLEAKRLLLYTDHGVAEIGRMTGFDDPAYFSRFFARRAGLAPAPWRARAGGRQGAGPRPGADAAPDTGAGA